VEINSDFADPLRAFNAAGVEYFVVGAYAVALHGRPRATGDLVIGRAQSIANKRAVTRTKDLADVESLLED
jgi:hypothetical protein